jgi:hypothetical protein
MARRYTAERLLGGAIVYDLSDNPIDKHTEVAALSPHKLDWGPDADEDALLQLAIALLTERRSWQTALQYYRELAAYIQDEYGDQDEWELRRSELIESNIKAYDAERFDDPLPRRGDVDIHAVDLDDITRAEEAALCNEYDISIHDREHERREQLQTVQDEGEHALARDDDEDAPETGLDDYHAGSADTEASTDDDQQSEDTSGDGVDAPDSDGGDPDSSAVEAPEHAAPASEDDPDAGEAAVDEAAADSEAQDDRVRLEEPDNASAVDDESTSTDASEATTTEDVEESTGEEPQPATLDALTETFRELDVDRAESVAAAYPTVEAVLAATPKELLEHEEIDEACVARLTETISWTVHTPVAEQLGTAVPNVAESDSSPSDGRASGEQADPQDLRSESGEEPALADGGTIPGEDSERGESAFEWVGEEAELVEAREEAAPT